MEFIFISQMLTIENISFSYNNELVLKNINANIEQGSSIAIIGESGCGKSTFLKLIYGLLDADQGHLFWNSAEIKGPKFHLIPGMPFMKYLAQDFDLMPYVTVAENVGKFLSNFFLEEKWKRVDELLDLVEMTEFKNRKAKYLSGGQMQRVALARVLAQEPEVLLLDEPFSHIDNFRKNNLRRKIYSYLKEKGITTLTATHDINDVLSYSDSIIVMKNAQIIEQVTPLDLYRKPQNNYSASLLDDVSEINWQGKNILAFPNQLHVVTHSEIECEVQEVYFIGGFYKIIAVNNTGSIIFLDKNKLSIGSKIFLEYKN